MQDDTFGPGTVVAKNGAFTVGDDVFGPGTVVAKNGAFTVGDLVDA